MEKELEKIIEQVLYNPQVSYPPVSYKITDVSENYKSEYIDKGDFDCYLKRLKIQLIFRLKSLAPKNQ